MEADSHLGEWAFPILSFASAVPSGNNGTGVNTNGYRKVSFIFLVTNATTVTGSAITFEQATGSSFGTKKALSIIPAYYAQCNDKDAAAAKLALTAMTSDTFTPQNVNSKVSVHIVTIDSETLDQANGYTWVRPVLATATAQTITVVAMPWMPRYAGEPVSPSL